MTPSPADPLALATALHIEKALYGGDGLAHSQDGDPVRVPFTLPGEIVAPNPLRVLTPSPDRTDPACVHFGTCGGCQYQMAGYPAQLAMKESILRELLANAGVTALPEIQTHASPVPYGYRNRIRLRVALTEIGVRLGYNRRNSNDFLPISMCPIAAPLLLRAAAALLADPPANPHLARWLEAAAEVELFTDAAETKLQLTLLYPSRPSLDPITFTKALDALKPSLPELSGAGAVRVDPRSNRSLETLASWGAAGLAYPVADETYWITRGAFFQVNRYLLPTLIDLVCARRTGTLAWDLFAGVGLFSRVLARRFRAVTAVEANPTAARDLQSALSRLGPQHRAVEATTLDFLRRAAVERDRPELIVLDPPRAGAGPEVCGLLARLAPGSIVYLSCDPTTLARDLALLTQSGYALAELHLIDLFPQTYHLETLAILHRP